MKDENLKRLSDIAGHCDYEDEKKQIEKSHVQHPSHYNREGAMECFDEFVLIYGVEAAKYACLFNIHKYRYRAADKNGAENLAKSDWYLQKYKELKEQGNLCFVPKYSCDKCG